MLVMTCIVPINSILQIAKVYSISSEMSFLIIFAYLVLNVATFGFLVMVTVAVIVISEKTSGRCEYYLANRANIWTLVKSYCLSTFLLCFMPVVLSNILIFIVVYVKKIEVLVELFISFRFMVFFMILILFCLCITMFLTVLTMVSKKPEKIRFYLSLSAFAITYATVLPMKFFVERGFTSDSISILDFFSIILLIISLIFGIFLYFMSKKMTPEVVVLSYKQ